MVTSKLDINVILVANPLTYQEAGQEANQGNINQQNTSEVIMVKENDQNMTSSNKVIQW